MPTPTPFPDNLVQVFTVLTVIGALGIAGSLLLAWKLRGGLRFMTLGAVGLSGCLTAGGAANVNILEDDQERYAMILGFCEQPLDGRSRADALQQMQSIARSDLVMVGDLGPQLLLSSSGASTVRSVCSVTVDEHDVVVDRRFFIYER